MTEVQQEEAASADGGERMRVLSVEVFSDHEHQNTRTPDSSSNTLTIHHYYLNVALT